MPTQALTFAATEVNMHWKDPYLTLGLNLKSGVVQPRGIYRGFRLGTNVAVRTVTMNADAGALDHVAVYLTTTGFALTIRKLASFAIDLTSPTYDNITVVIAIFATYSPGNPTAALVNVYTLAEYNALTLTQQQELLVVGQVDCGAPATLIGEPAISPKLRTTVSENVATEAPIWNPLMRNSSFEDGPLLGVERPYSVPHWVLGPFTGNLRFQLTAANPRTGAKSVALMALSALADTGSAVQGIHVSVVPGQILRMRFYLRCFQAATAGTLTFRVRFGDSSGALLGTTVDVTAAINVVDGGYRMAETTAYVPANAAVLTSARLELAGVSFPLAGLAIQFDDLQVWLETGGPLQFPLSDTRARELTAAPLMLEDTAGLDLASYSGGMLRLDAATDPTQPVAYFERRDQDATGVQIGLDLARLILGRNLNNTVARAHTARAAIPYVASGVPFGDATLLFESKSGAGDVGYRIYASRSSELWLTVNAFVDSTDLWNKDVSGQSATRHMFHQGRRRFQVRLAANNAPWSGWDKLVEDFDAAITANPTEHLNYQLDVGAAILTTNAERQRSRLSMEVGGGVTPVLLFETATALYPFRSYSDGSTTYYTSNASYDAGTGFWSKDTLGATATLAQHGHDTFIYASRLSGDDAPWSSWDNIRYDDAENQITYQDRKMVLGGGILVPPDTHAIPRIEMPEASSDSRLYLGQFALGAESTMRGRIYSWVKEAGGLNVDEEDAIEIAVNARWNGTLWTNDVFVAGGSDNLNESALYVFSNRGLRVFRRVSTSSSQTWSDYSYDYGGVGGWTGGTLYINGRTPYGFAANPTANGGGGVVDPEHLPVMWGRFSLAGGVVQADTWLMGGQMIALSSDGVTFAQDHGSMLVAPTARIGVASNGLLGTPGVVYTVQSFAGGLWKIKGITIAGVVEDPTSDTMAFNFVLYGWRSVF